MPPPPAGAAALLAALGLLVTACADAVPEPRLGSATIIVQTTSTVPVDPAPPTTLPGRGTVAAGDAQPFQELAPAIGDLSAGTRRFVEASSTTRLAELATAACATVSARMSDRELGLQGLRAYDGLGPDERAGITTDDWMILFGALIGFFCPDALPVATT